MRELTLELKLICLFNCQGEVSHDMILDFPYVDYVIHETLRMYPPAAR